MKKRKAIMEGRCMDYYICDRHDDTCKECKRLAEQKLPKGR